MSKGNLVRAPFSEITATLELFDRLGVTSENLENLRKSNSWGQGMISRLLSGESYLWSILEIECSAFKAGFRQEDFRKLAKNEDILKSFLDALRGNVRIVKDLIDCDAIPHFPGLSIMEHWKGGQFAWNPSRVVLYVPESQAADDGIVGSRLRKELAKQPVLNACVLDYLLAHPYLIPECWKEVLVFFWGTTYQDPAKGGCIRYLGWNGEKWHSYHYALNARWTRYQPAAILAHEVV